MLLGVLDDYGEDLPPKLYDDLLGDMLSKEQMEIFRERRKKLISSGVQGKIPVGLEFSVHNALTGDWNQRKTEEHMPPLLGRNMTAKSKAKKVTRPKEQENKNRKRKRPIIFTLS